MPGPDYAGTVVFYEDFPYAWWNDFRRARATSGRTRSRACRRTSACPRPTPTSATSSSARSPASRIYESQIERLFDGTKEMADAVRAHGRAMAELGDVAGAAERYWV